MTFLAAAGDTHMQQLSQDKGPYISLSAKIMWVYLLSYSLNINITGFNWIRYIWKLTWAAWRLYMSICKIVLLIILTVNNAKHGSMNNEECWLMTNSISGAFYGDSVLNACNQASSLQWWCNSWCLLFTLFIFLASRVVYENIHWRLLQFV